VSVGACECTCVYVGGVCVGVRVGACVGVVCFAVCVFALGLSLFVCCVLLGVHP